MAKKSTSTVIQKKQEQKAKMKAAYGMEGSFKICVSGAAAGDTLKTSGKKAYELGREIAMQGGVLLTGATIGLPFEAARGNFEHGGLCIGFSPAATAAAHIKSYRLPTEFHDVIVYTGFDYAGRNLLLTRAADAVITVGGRMGTLNEFTIAFEDKKIIGVLLDSGGIADEIPHLLHTANKELIGHLVFDTDPTELIKKVIAALTKRDKALRKKYA